MKYILFQKIFGVLSTCVSTSMQANHITRILKQSPQLLALAASTLMLSVPNDPSKHNLAYNSSLSK